MSIYTTSTLQTDRVTLTSIKRVCLVFKNIFITLLPFAILLALCSRSAIYYSANSMIGSWTIGQENMPQLESINISSFIFVLLPLFLQYPFFAFLLKVAHDKVEGNYNQSNLKQYITYTLIRAPRIIIAVFMGFTLILLGLICFILPGLYCISVFSMVLPLIAINNAGIIASFKRSFQLIKKSAIYTLITITFITAIPQAILHTIGVQLTSFITMSYINELLIILSLSILLISLCAGLIFLHNELVLREREMAEENAEKDNSADTLSDNSAT